MKPSDKTLFLLEYILEERKPKKPFTAAELSVLIPEIGLPTLRALMPYMIKKGVLENCGYKDRAYLYKLTDKFFEKSDTRKATVSELDERIQPKSKLEIIKIKRRIIDEILDLLIELEKMT